MRKNVIECESAVVVSQENTVECQSAVGVVQENNVECESAVIVVQENIVECESAVVVGQELSNGVSSVVCESGSFSDSSSTKKGADEISAPKTALKKKEGGPSYLDRKKGV